MQNTIPIKNGPSREELFDGQRLCAEERKTYFTLLYAGNEVELPVVMVGIESADGSGQSWNIKFTVRSEEVLLSYLPLEIRLAFKSKRVVTFRACYSTQKRKGDLTIEPVKQQRKYRLVIHNVTANKAEVEEIMQSELGNVKIIKWDIERTINYSGPVLGSGCNYQHKETIVLVEYQEN